MYTRYMYCTCLSIYLFVYPYIYILIVFLSLALSLSLSRYKYMYTHTHTHTYVLDKQRHIQMVGPPHVPTLFGVFLWPKTVRCVLADLFRSRNQSNTLQSRTIAQNQNNQNQKNPKNQKKTKKHYFRTLPFVYISKAILEE